LSVRPFLARELLNVPKLPYSPKELALVVRGAANANEKEREFSGTLSSGKALSMAIHVIPTASISFCGSVNLDDLYHVLSLSLPHTNLETVALFQGNTVENSGKGNPETGFKSPHEQRCSPLSGYF
jgi:hypothetical protein